MNVKLGSGSKILVKRNPFVDRSEKAIYIRSPFLIESSVADIRVFDEVLVYNLVRDKFEFVPAYDLRVELGVISEVGYSFGTSKGDILYDNDLKYWRKTIFEDTKMVVIVRDETYSVENMTAGSVKKLFDDGKNIELIGLQGVSALDLSDARTSKARITSAEIVNCVFDSVELSSDDLYLPNGLWNCVSL